MIDRRHQNIVGRTVRLLRHLVGWNLKTAAAATGVSSFTLSGIESGRQIPDLATAERISSAMGFSPAVWSQALGLVYAVSATFRAPPAAPSGKGRSTHRYGPGNPPENGWALLLLRTVVMPAILSQDA